MSQSANASTFTWYLNSYHQSKFTQYLLHTWHYLRIFLALYLFIVSHLKFGDCIWTKFKFKKRHQIFSQTKIQTFKIEEGESVNIKLNLAPCLGWSVRQKLKKWVLDV